MWIVMLAALGTANAKPCKSKAGWAYNTMLEYQSPEVIAAKEAESARMEMRAPSTRLPPHGWAILTLYGDLHSANLENIEVVFSIRGDVIGRQAGEWNQPDLVTASQYGALYRNFMVAPLPAPGPVVVDVIRAGANYRTRFGVSSKGCVEKIDVVR